MKLIKKNRNYILFYIIIIIILFLLIYLLINKQAK